MSYIVKSVDAQSNSEERHLSSLREAIGVAETLKSHTPEQEFGVYDSGNNLPIWRTDDSPALKEYTSLDHEEWQSASHGNHPMSDKPSIYFDIDGTLGKWYADGRGLSLEEMIDPTNHYFRTIEPVETIVELAKQLQEAGADVCIISAAYRDTIRDKWEWVQEHLSFIPEENICFAPIGADKSQFVKGNADISILLDDYNKNLDEWKGTSVKVLNGINSPTPFVQDVNFLDVERQCEERQQQVEALVSQSVIPESTLEDVKNINAAFLAEAVQKEAALLSRQLDQLSVQRETEAFFAKYSDTSILDMCNELAKHPETEHLVSWYGDLNSHEPAGQVIDVLRAYDALIEKEREMNMERETLAAIAGCGGLHSFTLSDGTHYDATALYQQRTEVIQHALENGLAREVMHEAAESFSEFELDVSYSAAEDLSVDAEIAKEERIYELYGQFDAIYNALTPFAAKEIANEIVENAAIATPVFEILSPDKEMNSEEAKQFLVDALMRKDTNVLIALERLQDNDAAKALLDNVRDAELHKTLHLYRGSFDINSEILAEDNAVNIVMSLSDSSYQELANRCGFAQVMTMPYNEALADTDMSMNAYVNLYPNGTAAFAMTVWGCEDAGLNSGDHRDIMMTQSEQADAFEVAETLLKEKGISLDQLLARAVLLDSERDMPAEIEQAVEQAFADKETVTFPITSDFELILTPDDDKYFPIVEASIHNLKDDTLMNFFPEHSYPDFQTIIAIDSSNIHSLTEKLYDACVSGLWNEKTTFSEKTLTQMREELENYQMEETATPKKDTQTNEEHE